MFLALVSAVITLSVTTNPSTLSSLNETTSFVVKVDATTSIANFTDASGPVTITDANGNKVLLSLSTTSTLTDVSDVTYTVKVNSVEDDFSFAQETKEVIIEATNNLAQTDTINVPLSFERDYCRAGEVGDLDIKIDINNNGRGKNDEWYLLDDLDVEVKVSNDGNDDIDNVIVAWAVVNKNTGEIIIDDEESDFNVKDGDDKTITFNIQLDPDDFSVDDIGNDFMLVVKAYGDDVGEDVQCISASESSELFGDDFMIVDVEGINLPESLQCGANINVDAKVWNVGSDTQDEVSVKVLVREFNFDKLIEVGDIDELSDESFTFNLVVPENAKEGTYGLRFEVYDEDGDLFQDEGDDDSIFFRTFDVSGNCDGSSTTGGQNTIDISASLESEAVAGKELVVKVNLINTGSTSTSYQILATEYNDWASLSSIEPRAFTLNSGESKNIMITLVPNVGVSGDKEFVVQVVHEGVITEQGIKVPIQSQTNAGITGASIAESLKSNWFIWVIVLVNIVLVLLIIIVAVRVARK